MRCPLPRIRSRSASRSSPAAIASLLLSDDGRSRLRSTLLLAWAQERQRLAVLRRAWPAQGGGNPYGEPSWLAPEHAELEIERAIGELSALVQGGGAQAATSAAAPPPPAPAGEPAPQRRPLGLPAIQAADALGAERAGPGDERAGAG